jgi:hypothetical protein
MCAEKLALRATPGIIMMPRQFRPDHRIPYFCAARSAASASEPAPWPRSAVIISAPAAPLSRLIDDTHYRRCWRRNHHDFGHKLQFVETTDGADAVDLGIVGIHQPKIHL